MIDMEKINYKDEAENWIMNEGPMDMADILADVLESDAFEDNSYYDKLEYADHLAKELRKFENDMKKYDLRTDANNNIVAMNDGFFENTAKLVSPACFNPDDYFTVEKSKAIYRISKNDYRIRKDRYDKFLAKID